MQALLGNKTVSVSVYTQMNENSYLDRYLLILRLRPENIKNDEIPTYKLYLKKKHFRTPRKSSKNCIVTENFPHGSYPSDNIGR